MRTPSVVRMTPDFTIKTIRNRAFVAVGEPIGSNMSVQSSKSGIKNG
jgi:hypothetical protein